MYRQQLPQQQHPYSLQQQQDQFHVRQPESTLFEDSPQHSTSNDIFDPIQNPPKIVTTQHQNFGSRGQKQQQQQYEHNYQKQRQHQHSEEQQQERGRKRVSKKNNFQTTEEEEQERRLLFPQQTSQHQAMSQEQKIEMEGGDTEREAENDIEFIIMNLYSKMKNLEGKYIDLANFYKQELVKTSTFKKSGEDSNRNRQHLTAANLNQQIKSGDDVTPSKSFERSAGAEDISPEIPSERDIIRDLIEEKKKLEDDMKQMIQIRGSGIRPLEGYQQSPQPMPTDFNSAFQHTQLQSQQQDKLRSMQKQLTDALQEVIESVEISQKKELQILTSKQNEMYTLSQRYNLPQNVRNESLGLWYDAKTKISQCMSDIKFQVQKKQKDLEYTLSDNVSGGLLTSYQSRPKIRQKLQEQEHNSLKQMGSFDQTGYQINDKLIQDLSKEMKLYKRKIEQQQKQIQSLRNGLQFQDMSIKDDQNKAQSILKDAINQLQQLDNKEYLMLSGDKRSQNIMMSPFEKRIANYQKSAEMRKSGDQQYQQQNRSGSRGRPTTGSGVGLPMSNTGSNFYQRAPIDQSYSNPQMIVTQQQQIPNAMNMSGTFEQSNEFKYINNKLKNLGYQLEDISAKINLRSKEQEELDHLLGNISQESQKFIKQADSIIQNNQNQRIINKNSTSDNLHQSTFSPYRGQYSKQNESASTAQNFYSGSRVEHQVQQHQPSQFQQEKKVTELQKNNDTLFTDLRKTNEKYLNLRVENNKLKDEIQILQNALQDSNNQLKKFDQQPVSAPQRQQIKRKTAGTQRVDSFSNAPNQQNHKFGPHSNSYLLGQGPIDFSNEEPNLQNENDELKKRIQDLEKECFTLTYHQQELQRRGSQLTIGSVGGREDQQFIRMANQENQDLKGKIEQMCLHVQRFMLAMKRLQRAVNNKDKDIQIFKSEFETNKKTLELLVKETKEQLEQNKSQPNLQQQFQSMTQFPTHKNPNLSILSGNGGNQNAQIHQSMMVGRDQRFGDNQSIGGSAQQRNKSQVPLASSNINRAQNNIPQYSYQQHNSASQRNDGSNKKGTIRPKTQFSQQQKQQEQQDLNSSQEQQQNLASSPSQELQFNKLLEEVKSLQEENDQQKQSIDNLKQVNENLQVDKNQLDVQLKSKQINSQKLQQQVKATADSNQRLETIIDEYKEAINQIEINNLNRNQISKMKTDLLIKEKDLINAQLNQDNQYKLQPSASNTSLKSQRDLQFEQQRLTQQILIIQLREELTSQIEAKEQDLDRQFSDLNQLVQEKEDDINKLKKLFVEKLKEIETSFVEISQEMVENEQVQQEASRRMHSQIILGSAQHPQSKAALDLEKSIEQVIGKYEDDQREEELNQMIEANQELQDQNTQMSNEIRDLEKQVHQLKEERVKLEELEILREKIEQLDETISDNRDEIQKKNRQIEEFKQDKKNLQVQLRDLNKNLEKIQNNHQKQVNEWSDNLDEVKLQLKSEEERRILFESEYNNKDKQLKSFKVEYKNMENEVERLKLNQKELNSNLANLKTEHEYQKSLTASKDQLQSDTINQFNDETEQLKIEENPKLAANSYLRMLKSTNKELIIQQKNYEKLDQKFKEQKECFNEMKLESRQNVEQNLNMENKIFELTSENETLIKELDKIKGSYKVEEEEIKAQIEIQFRERIQFKESEVESMTIKLERITLLNGELEQKVVRLERCNQELSSDNQDHQNKISALEMELEMTKSNGERDLDQLIEQEKQKQLLERTKLETEKAKMQIAINEQNKQFDQEKSLLEEKIAKKKEKLNNQKAQNQGISQQTQQQNLMQEMIKKSIEDKLKQTEELLNQEKKARKEFEKEKQQEQERQIKLIEELKQQQEQEKLNLTIKQQQDLKKKHDEQIVELQKQLRQERIELEEQLNQKEQENLQNLKISSDQEKQKAIKAKEEEQLIQIERLNQEFEVKEKLKLQKLEDQLKQDAINQERNQKKSISLIQVLQKKAREVLLDEINKLQDSQLIKKTKYKQQKQQLMQEIQTQKDNLKQNEQRQQQELQQLQQKHDQLLLEELEHQQRNLEQSKSNDLQQEKSQAQQLQEKIRNDLLNQIETLKSTYKQELDEQHRHLEREKTKHRHELEELDNKSQSQLQKEKQDLEKELQQQKSKELSEQQLLLQKNLEKQRAEYQQQIKDLQEKHYQEIEEQKQELERLKKEEEELFNSMSKQQDKQTQDLLVQKEQEKEHVLKKLNEDHKKFEKDIQHKDEQIRQLKEDFDKEIQNLETKNKVAFEQKGLIIDGLKTEQIKKQQEFQEKIYKLDQEYQQLEDSKEQLQSQFDEINKKLQEEGQAIKKLKASEQKLQSDNKDLQEQKQQLLEQHEQEIQKLNIQIQKLLKEAQEIKNKKEQELQKLKQDHQDLVQEIEQQKLDELDSLKNQLEEDHKQLSKKKDQEKSIFEKMQEKVRNELKIQLEEKDAQRKEKIEEVQNLEKEIQSKEQDIQKERMDQQELIDQMNLKMKQYGEQKILLEKENEKLKKELDIIKKQQQESEKQLIKQLRDSQSSLEQQNEELLKDKKHKEIEIQSLNQQLKAKDIEIQNLGKDLDQFALEDEEDKAQNQEKFDNIKHQLQQMTELKDQRDKENQKTSLELKMKEALLKQLKDKIEEQDENLKTKDFEVQQIQDTKNSTQRTLDKQLKDLQNKNSELEKQNQDLQSKLQDFNLVMDEIDKSINQFELELSNIKQINQRLKKFQEFSENILSCIKNDQELEVVGDIGSQEIQFCKRVKHQGQAWILVSKKENFYWINQNSFQVDKLSKLNLDTSSTQDQQNLLQEKLDDLVIQKELVLKKMQEENIRSSRSDSERLMNIINRENGEMKLEIQELQLANNQLQQSNIQLKQKNNELNDMVFGLTDTQRNQDSIKKILELHNKNEQQTKELLQSLQTIRELEGELDQRRSENEKLKKQISESEYSFAKQGSSVVMRPENFNLEQSSIDQKEDSQDGEGEEKVKRLETEIEEYQKLNEDLQQLNKTLQVELKEIKKSQQQQLSGSQQVMDQEIQDQLKHTRSILVRFLEKTPITTKENEDLLPIIYSMMLFTKEEMNQVKKQRDTSAEQIIKASQKKGVFGMFGKNQGGK